MNASRLALEVLRDARVGNRKCEWHRDPTQCDCIECRCARALADPRLAPPEPVACGEFRCAGWISRDGTRRQHKVWIGRDQAEHHGVDDLPECDCECGFPFSAHAAAQPGCSATAVEPFDASRRVGPPQRWGRKGQSFVMPNTDDTPKPVPAASEPVPPMPAGWRDHRRCCNVVPASECERIHALATRQAAEIARLTARLDIRRDPDDGSLSDAIDRAEFRAEMLEADKRKQAQRIAELEAREQAERLEQIAALRGLRERAECAEAKLAELKRSADEINKQRHGYWKELGTARANLRDAEAKLAALEAQEPVIHLLGQDLYARPVPADTAAIEQRDEAVRLLRDARRYVEWCATSGSYGSPEQRLNPKGLLAAIDKEQDSGQ